MEVTPSPGAKRPMRTKSPLHRGMCVLLLGLSACQEVPTLATPNRSDQSPQAVKYGVGDGAHMGQVALTCVVGRRTPSVAPGWQTRRETLFYPRSELDERGRTVQYQYRQASSDGKLLVAADCGVPYTEAALSRVDRTFRVQRNGGAEQFVARQGMVTTQGCVLDQKVGCLLEPIVVSPPPTDTPVYDPCDYDPVSCGGTGGGGGGGGGGSGGGGGGSDAFGEGPGAFGACVVALTGVLIGTASLQPYANAVYEAAGAVNSERRMLDAITQNGGSPEMIQLYQTRYELAESSYKSAIMNFAIAGGVAVGAVGVAVGVCSPALLLPTP